MRGLLSLRATMVRARDKEIDWDILADPEGNEFCVFAPRPQLRWHRLLGDSAESLGAERGIITKVEVDVALERAIGVERGPAAAAHVVALVGALPRELDARPAITIRVAAVEFSRHRDEPQSAETVLIELDEAGLDQVDGLLIPVVHLGDTPPAYDL